MDSLIPMKRCYDLPEQAQYIAGNAFSHEPLGVASNQGTIHQIFAEHAGYVSDKWEHYLTIYDAAFRSFLAAGKPIKLLEIGVQNGGSLQIWSKYLPRRSSIVGVDIDPACAELSFETNVAILTGDAANAATLDRLLGDACFDIIIDDGSHRSEDVIAAFEVCFDRLNPGGIYAIEDLHASYFASHGGGFRLANSSIEWLKGLVDSLNADHFQGDACKRLNTRDLDRLHTLGRQVASISFFDSLALITKLPDIKHQPYRRIITGRDTPVWNMAAQGISAWAPIAQRTLKLTPSASAAFSPAILAALASERERVTELQASLSRAGAEASVWETRARQHAQTCEELAARVNESQSSTKMAIARAEQAEIRAVQAEVDRDAMLNSTTWRATAPLRTVANYLSSASRQTLRARLKLIATAFALKTTQQE
jgi:SAM-dependent methyltransferase